MSEFFGNYGFFILVALLMLTCHLGHGRHGGHGRNKDHADGTSGESERHHH